ncbi:hypothetical protein V7056_19660 [Bacillus sp. JJ664]
MFKYTFNLNKKKINIEVIKALELYIQNEKIEVAFRQSEKNYEFITCKMEPSKFNILQEYFNRKHNFKIEDCTIIDYDHYHIERYKDKKNIHSATAFKLSECTWELYYQEGVLYDSLPKLTGALEDEGKFIFDLVINDKEEKKKLELAFDEWLNNL